MEGADPFLLLDHFGPVDYAPGEAVGAPDHPHRGFETVTYILDGAWQHKDSAGNCGNLTAGMVQWMTAGAGVVHSEMPSDEMIENGGHMEGFQLWVNLPARDKMIPPRYQDTPSEAMPIVTSPDGLTTVKVVAGSSLGATSPIQVHSPILYLDVRLQPGGSFTQPVAEGMRAYAYCYRGSGAAGVGSDRKAMAMGQAAKFSDGDTVTLHAAEGSEARFLLLAGTPLDEPVVHYGPFVMNTEREIEQALFDYQTGRLGSIAGSEERYAKTEAARRRQAENRRG